MAHVYVEYTAQIKKSLGLASENYPLESSDTLTNLLEAIRRRHGEATIGPLLDNSWQLVSSVLVFVNDEQVQPATNPVLRAAETVAFVCPVSGG